MRILALITARAGSKRIPRKNSRLLGNKPLISWSIDSAKDIPEISNILVSTDDPEILEIALDAQVLAPWLRPAELSTDTATSVDTCIHALDWYESNQGSVDGLLLLQPTSPFRSKASLLQGIHLFNSSGLHQVVGFSPAESHPMWCYRVESSRVHPFIESGGIEIRSQDLPPAYVINGAFYLTSPMALRQTRSFFSENMVPLVMNDPKESIDIDTEQDWILAEMILNELINKPIQST